MCHPFVPRFELRHLRFVGLIVYYLIIMCSCVFGGHARGLNYPPTKSACRGPFFSDKHDRSMLLIITSFLKQLVVVQILDTNVIVLDIGFI